MNFRLANKLENFPRNWEQFYEQSWNPCRCKIVPNLSRYALTTHNSMVWAVNPKLRSADGKNLPVRFNIELGSAITAHTCEIYDGHHKMFQMHYGFGDMNWQVNVADLNNIQYKD